MGPGGSCLAFLSGGRGGIRRGLGVRGLGRARWRAVWTLWGSVCGGEGRGQEGVGEEEGVGLMVAAAEEGEAGEVFELGDAAFAGGGREVGGLGEAVDGEPEVVAWRGYGG